MITVCYISRSLIGGDVGKLIDIWYVSQQNNRRRGISGGLYCDSDVFLQVLEGAIPAVTRAMHKIFADKRHCDVQVIYGAQIEARRFAAWDMKVVNAMSDEGMAERFHRDRILNSGQRYIDARLSEMLEV